MYSHPMFGYINTVQFKKLKVTECFDISKLDFKSVFLGPHMYTCMVYCPPLSFLSSANKVWVGHRNAGCPSIRLSIGQSNCRGVHLSVIPPCERDILGTVSPIDFKFEI